VDNQVEPSTDEKPTTRPVRDEWGIYDPGQAGLAAVARRLLEAAGHPVTDDRGAGAK
jgi:hypothetical protein